MTTIKPCTCEHPYQDRKYGKGRRVKNSTADTPVKWRCTVCGKDSS